MRRPLLRGLLFFADKNHHDLPGNKYTRRLEVVILHKQQTGCPEPLSEGMLMQGKM